MKYTLTQNAISSFHIAVENFKNFYYNSDILSESKLNEYIKISLTFLENSVELLIKSILVTYDEKSIYISQNEELIKKAIAEKPSNIPLSDILIGNQNIKTIKYSELIKKYNKEYHNSRKLYDILHLLGEARNQIAHFGIRVYTYDEILILFFNVFDVIYNYLYPHLIKLDDIGEYFTSDELYVKTVHGIKRLIDKNGEYGNFVDFLDELLGDCRDYFCSMRAHNPKTKIIEFEDCFWATINNNRFLQLSAEYRIKVDLSMCETNDNYYLINFMVDDKEIDYIYSWYSPYYNATIFFDKNSNISFIVLHEKGEMYIYSVPTDYSSYDTEECEERWYQDLKKRYCKKVKLSSENIFKIFKTKFNEIKNLQ